METILAGSGVWAISYLSRRLIAQKLFKKDTNDLVENIGSSANFAINLGKRELKQDFIKGIIPVGLGILGIASGIYEIFIGNVEPAMALLSFGALHLAEGQLNIVKRRKDYKDATKG